MDAYELLSKGGALAFERDAGSELCGGLVDREEVFASEEEAIAISTKQRSPGCSCFISRKVTKRGFVTFRFERDSMIHGGGANPKGRFASG